MGSPPARLLVPEVPPPSLDLPMPRRARPVPAPGPHAAIAVVAAALVPHVSFQGGGYKRGCYAVHHTRGKGKGGINNNN